MTELISIVFMNALCLQLLQCELISYPMHLIQWNFVDKTNVTDIDPTF